MSAYIVGFAYMDIEEFESIERTISGKGLVEIPEDWGGAYDIYLYTQVLRTTKTPSLNLTFNPDKSFYAHICFCIDEYVLFSLDVNFKQQVFEILTAQSSQNLLSLICAYDGILDSFVQLGNAVSAVISRTNLIKAHPYERFKPNKIRFECFADTALILTLKGHKFAKCTPEDGQSIPPPPPPQPSPQVPPGSPVQVSPPLSGENDGGDTVPFPIDAFPPVIVQGRLLFTTVDQTGATSSWAVPGTSADSLAMLNGQHPGCTNGGQNLFVSTTMYYSRWSCTARVTITSQQFSPGTVIPAPYVFVASNV